MAHEIRLAGPWEYSVDDGKTWTRCTLPVSTETFDKQAAGADVRLRRKFHKPSGLESFSVLHIIIVTNHELPEIELNDGQIAVGKVRHDAHQPLEVTNHFCVTGVLNDFNTIEVRLAQTAQNLSSAIMSAGLSITET